MKPVWKIWWIALAVKIVIAVFLPFANDEAYYWVWGHHPHLSYFDHPAMVGWLFWLGRAFENVGHAARLPGVFLGHLTLLIWSAILAPYLTDKQKKFWLIFLLFSPFLGLGSLILTPDVPFLFFWSLSLFLFLRAVETNRWQEYAALGVSLGLGFCSKYLIVLFVPCALLWLYTTGAWRKVDWRKVPATIALGLLFCAPVLVWNAQNEWASFKFQMDHGLESARINRLWPLEYLGTQIGILFPIAFYFAVKKRPTRETSFLHIFGWLPLAFFFYTSFRARVEGNWPSMAHPEILALAFLNAGETKWMKVQLACWITALVVIFSQVVTPWIPLDAKKLKTNEFTKYDSLLPLVAEHSELYASSYQMASALSYKTRKQIYKLVGMNRRDFYDFTPQSRPSGDSFFVIAETLQTLPEWVAQSGFHIVTERKLNEDFRLIEVTKLAQDSHR